MSEQTWTIRQLNEQLTRTLRSAFPGDIWICGEVSSKRNGGGHVYLDLIERESPDGPIIGKLPVVCFRNTLPSIHAALHQTPGVTVRDGVQVRLRGRIGLHGGRGTVQLVMSGIDGTYTLGKLAADRDAVLRTLLAEGVAGANKTLPLPAAPLRIGLVTSVGSAAYADFTQELLASGLAFEVLAVDARVQGPNAPASLRAALGDLAARAGAGVWVPDVVALVRGGGSRTDLAAFDTETVARAITTMPVPVLTGIGHEIDRAVADDVAHTPFKTPTACAQALIGAVRGAGAQVEVTFAAAMTSAGTLLHRRDRALESAGAALARSAGTHLTRSSERLSATSDRVATCAATTLTRRADQVQVRTEHLVRAASGALARPAADLNVAAATIHAHDPARVLARGYSITRGPDGRALTDPAAAPAGTPLVTVLAGGQLRSVTTAPDPAPDPASDPAPEPVPTPGSDRDGRAGA